MAAGCSIPGRHLSDIADKQDEGRWFKSGTRIIVKALDVILDGCRSASYQRIIRISFDDLNPCFVFHRTNG